MACYPAGILAAIVGRKPVLLSSSLFALVSFILLMIASKVWIIVLARVLQGFETGIVMTVLPMYVSEISTDNIRGATGSLMQLNIVKGVLYVYAIGPYVSYQALQWICLPVPVIFAAIFVFLPESPYFYVGKNRLEEASKALQFLRGQSAESVKDALNDIETFTKDTAQQQGTVTDLFKISGNRTAFFISAPLLMFQQLSGNTTVLFNTQSILQGARTGLDAAVGAIVVGVLQVVASVVTPLIVDRVGRKIILLISSAVLSIALFALGAYFFIELGGNDTSNILWLPLTCLTLYIVFYSISFGPLPWVVLSEIFPANVKPIASAIAASLCLLTGFLMSYFYPFLSELGAYYIFWLFAVSCLIAFIFVLIFVFETKGIGLQQIQNRLNKKSNSESTT